MVQDSTMRLSSPFGNEVAFVFIEVSSPVAQTPVKEEEAALLSPSVHPKRRTEFFAGRFAAHQALQGAGLTESPPILKGELNEPLWPKGFCGSIAHSRGIALAAACRQVSGLTSIGLDIESLQRRIHPNLHQKIADLNEIKWLDLDKEGFEKRVLTLFSIKEAVYKALAPTVQKVFWFEAVSVALEDDGGSFIATVTNDLHPQVRAGTKVRGRVLESEDYILSGAVFTL